VAQGLYDIHGAGMGAAPHRDGVNTGGHMNIPSAGISDIERIEMQYLFSISPLAQLRRQRFRSAPRRNGQLPHLSYLWSRIAVSITSPTRRRPGRLRPFRRLSYRHRPNRSLIQAGLEMLDKIRTGDHPTGQAMRAGEWGKSFLPAACRSVSRFRKESLLVDYVAGGGGSRSHRPRPPSCAEDFGRGWVSRETGERVYGVILSGDGKAIDARLLKGAAKRSVNLANKALRPISGKNSGLSASGAMAGDKHCDSTRRWRCVPTASRKYPLQSLRPLVLDAKEKLQALALHRSLHLKRSCRLFLRRALYR